MLPPDSRYSTISTATYTRADGVTIVYLRRRLLPDPERLAQIALHAVVAGERPDLVAARYYANPALWWRIANANGVHDPAELTDTPGRRLRITLPEGIPGPAHA